MCLTAALLISLSLLRVLRRISHVKIVRPRDAREIAWGTTAGHHHRPTCPISGTLANQEIAPCLFLPPRA
jgi:hypothetical protein